MNARLAVVAAGSTIAAVAAVIAPSAIPSASAEPCPAVEVIFARGTGEPPGIGRVGQAFADSLRQQIGYRTMNLYAVDFPASYDFTLAGVGAVDATARVVSMSQKCPATRLVLGGYSQGAAVVDIMTGVPPVLNRDFGNPLPPTVADNVAAVAVFGNPAAKFGHPVSVASPLYAGKAIDMCKDGDPICSDGRNPFAHSDYVSAGLHNQAASFVAGLV